MRPAMSIWPLPRIGAACRLLGCRRKGERRNDAVRNLIDHRNVARHAALIGRDVGETDFSHILNGLDRPQNGGRLRRERQIAQPLCSAIGGRRIENADRRDRGRRRLDRARERSVSLGILGADKSDVDRDRARMERRQALHDLRDHLAGRSVSARFAQRLVVDRDNGHIRRRGARAGEEKAPVKGEVLDPVERRRKADDL